MEDRITYEKFCELLLAELKKCFPAEYFLEVHDIVKNNGIHLDSLTIRGKEQRISPNFYLNHFYEQYQQGAGLAELTDNIVCLYEQSIKECASIMVDVSYENCQDKIVLRLASGVWNSEILEQVPFLPFMDMVILFYVVMWQDGEGIGSIRISSRLQEQWNISTQTLFNLALENSMRLFPEKISSLIHTLEEQAAKSDSPFGDEEEFTSFMEREYGGTQKEVPLVITNNYGINGATVILYPNLLEKIGEMLGSDYYLLPSSIHEFLAIPSNPELSGEKMEMMVREVNRTCVAREELLSEKVYYYNIQTRKISMCEV